jgi:menaquinone-specific isochorismate synthase
MSTAPLLEPLAVATVELTGDDAERAGDLLSLLPGVAPLAWVRHGEGLVGWGEAARFVVSGRDRFARAVRWWRSLHLDAVVSDDLGLPGTGPVVFGSFAFADGPTPSVLILPRMLVGRRDGKTWVTSVGRPPRDLSPSELAPIPTGPSDVRYSAGTLSADGWREAVVSAVGRIHAGELSKVVLARELIARTPEPVDPRHLLRALAERYPACFTFSVHGLVGATPELLVRRYGDRVASRVLAGTAWRRPAPGSGPGEQASVDDPPGERDDDVAARLFASAKDREEHAYAARSAAEALRPFCSKLNVPAEPEVLALANVAHLASEVTGTLKDGRRDDTCALALAGALHPTAAVCGTPKAAAAELISSLEGMDRGRYAGPVGWMDSAGDGEWGIALRCAELDGSRLRLFAGCGIVAGSDPDTELAEAQAKFVAVREALES